MGVLLLGGVFPSVFEGGGELCPEDQIGFLDIGGLCSVGTCGEMGLLGINPVVY